MHGFRSRALLVMVAGLVGSAGCGAGSNTPSTPGGDSGIPATPGVPSAAGVTLDEDLKGRRVFPQDNWWNLDIGGAPIDGASGSYIARMSSARMHPDFGPPPYGIPYVVVSGDQALRQVDFVAWPEESDAGAPGRPTGYPIPDEAISEKGYVEGDVAGGGSDGDRHLLVMDRDRWLLFETGATQWNSGDGRWEANCGAVFDLSSNARREEGLTSADAAGLAIFPGLVRYDEVYGLDEITHAFRVTVSNTNSHVWPASHSAGSTSGALPMGARLRLKNDVVVSGPPEIQKIFRAMKKYGLIVADNGSNMYVSGTMDARWDNDVLNPAFHGLHASDFEVVKLGWAEP